MCVCVAKPVAVELRCHATALIITSGLALDSINGKTICPDQGTGVMRLCG